jgi:hypothetical protein
MAALAFRCPDTGLHVQTWIATEPADGEEVYETVSCSACRRVHLVNVRSGRVIGRARDK